MLLKYELRRLGIGLIFQGFVRIKRKDNLLRMEWICCQGCITLRFQDRLKLLLLNLKYNGVGQVSALEVRTAQCDDQPGAATSITVGGALNPESSDGIFLDWL
jgi:hypothetical protein